MRRRTAKARLLGYTLMEVMVSMAVLAVGASGVIALQKVTGVGNTNTRNLAAANRIAAKWAERLSFDSLQWDPALGFSNTYWLKTAAAPGQWAVPAEVSSYASPDADVLGADLFPGDPAQPAFCTHIRLTPLPGFQQTIRAEVRVFWDKAGNPVSCGVAPDVVSASPDRYASVHTLVGVIGSQ
jgi:prepilin-type N-terminal cleavage/methylation domain-containing protein